MAERLGARYVAVAHTADDQVETVLHRIVRGTGLAGLAGMPFARPLSPSVALVRPLLLARRRDVLQYLSEIGQDFREDASNEDWRFTRNRLRHGLLPLLRRQYNPDVDAALLRLAAQAGEAQKLLAEQAALLADRFVVVEAGRDVRIDCSQLADKPRLILREVCKAAWARAGWPQQDADFDLWQQLAELVMHPESGAPTLNLPGNIRAARQGEEIVLRPSLEFS
jgi:tRNA(Ile)-lysidine synthase